MRNPARIEGFLDTLREIWSVVPDWRFGQLMSNFFGWYVGKTSRDIFFPEDDEMLSALKEFAKEVIGYEVKGI